MKIIATAHLLLFAWTWNVLAGEEPTISPAMRDTYGILVHEVVSPFQSGTTRIRVLLPDGLRPGKSYTVVYVLPVEANDGTVYGDGLQEVKKHDLPNKHSAIFVAPTFSRLPWYADHPTNPEIRQETYFLHVVIPFVEKTYPAKAQPEGRLLLGFSKSGWGAWSLLLRNPDLFGKAAAWDAPMMMDQLGKYGTTEIFETEENLDKYQISTLLRERAKRLAGRSRLILLGYGGFRADHQAVHALMESLDIPHAYRDGPQRKHDWHSGWASEAVELLFGQN